jgi:ferritin-like metal-binding protein YciE
MPPRWKNRASCSCRARDLLFAENTLIKALPKLAEEANDVELQKGFESHLEETKQHVANLKQVFKTIGEPAKAEKCPAIEGITKEHDEFMTEENPSPAICDMFLTGSGALAEHYEIAAYNGPSRWPRRSAKDAVPLLGDLKQEEAALAKLEKAAKRLAGANA